MALVKLGGGLGEIRGSIGNWTFARNKGGQYIRNRAIPINPNTDRQSTVRACMAYLVDRWANTLTAAQRTAWNLYASNVSVLNRLGEAIYLSGFNHYIRSNLIAKMIALTVVDAGPVVFEIPAQDPTYAITASEATQQISAAYDDTMDWADETGAHLILFGGKPQNPQRNFFGGPWRLYGQMAGVTGAPPASPHAGTSGYPFAELHHLWGYARIRRADGRLSEPFRDDTFCAA